MSTRREFIKGTALASTSLALAHACRRYTAVPAAEAVAASSLETNAARALRERLHGRVILPSDADYEVARRVSWWNPVTAPRPAMLVQCNDESDIARSIEFARKQELGIAVRSGGHSNMRWGTGDGLVIDVSRLKGITIDPVRRAARVGAGVTAGELVIAAYAHGLAPVLGECDTVGAGLALGGGLGWLAGSHGATCDNVLSARVITAGTDAVTASAASSEDLYWAIRGGGGNFGVISEFQHRLHPIGAVLAGGLAYSARDARPVMRFFREFMAAAPDDFQALAYLTPGGGGTLLIVLVYSGPLKEGERLVEQFRKFRMPLRDWVELRPYRDVYIMPPYAGDSSTSPAPVYHEIRGTYIERLSDDAIDAILSRYAAPPPARDFGFDLDHYVHGQVSRIASDATAFELRTPGAIHMAFGAEWDAPEQSAACIAWLDETYQLLQRFSGGRTYTNYASVEGRPAAESAYGRNYSRLAFVKRRYDPENVFRRNLNISPG